MKYLLALSILFLLILLGYSTQIREGFIIGGAGGKLQPVVPTPSPSPSSAPVPAQQKNQSGATFNTPPQNCPNGQASNGFPCCPNGTPSLGKKCD